MVSNEAILEYQETYKKYFGTEISNAEALEQGERLIRLFKIIYRPIPKAWIKNIKNGKQK